MLRTFAFVLLLTAAIVTACSDATPTGSGVLPGDQAGVDDGDTTPRDATVEATTDAADAADATDAASTDAADATDGS